MTAVATKNSVQTRQHQAIHAHLKFLVSALGKLDLQSCQPRIADSKSLKNRIALYRWSLNDFKKAIQCDIELHDLVFPGNPLLKSILREYRQILEQINHALTSAENASNNKILREELNVILVKINLTVNAICETIKLNLIKEDAFAKSLNTSSNALASL
jgi:hypothetical protein